MHEAKFTEQIVDQVVNELKGYIKSKPKRIKVRVGEMFHLDKDSVQFYYDLLTKETQLDGVQLDLEEEPVKVMCLDCRKESGVEDHHLLMCSLCGSRHVEIIAGNQVVTEFIELDDVS